ncbi:MAG: VOC family protein [Erysipelotrichaceae bacterium]|nr:VOC family protein [Erysipelotrichaceae bacterium]
MRISNMGLMVKDLEGARKFFEDYFGAVLHAEYSEDNGYKSYIMKFDENPKIELMTKPEIVDVVKTRNDAGFIHICIKVDSKEQFETILEKIRSAGYEILYEPATVGGQEFRAITFEDNIIEVCY